MTTPKNVLLFEVLLYLSLVLDALSVAFQDRTPDATLTDSVIMVANFTAAAMILGFVYLVWLAAQRRKNWPRWVLIAALTFSVLSLAQIIGESGIQAGTFVDILSCALTAAGLYLSFTGDAKGWFDGSPT
jgi:peptidoglycan/LPS O-acetylase OafA/YrhL